MSPNKGPNWRRNPGWDPQTRHNFFFLGGSTTGCPPMSYEMGAVWAKARRLEG